MPHAGSTAPGPALAGAIPQQRATPRNAGRVAVVSASVGAGHDGAAAELERRLAADGFTVDRYDLMDLLPAGLGRAVRDGYHRMLVMAPWAYQRIYAGTEVRAAAALWQGSCCAPPRTVCCACCARTSGRWSPRTREPAGCWAICV
ncbi:hypothetical protein ACWEQN_37225 [Streptomyces sp. NPDC004129]